MELKKNMILKVAVLLFLFGVAATVDARSHNKVKILRGGELAKSDKAKEEACCDNNYCTETDPPVCRCSDITSLEEGCHSACDLCICLPWGVPLEWTCNCADETNFPYPPCTNDSSKIIQLPKSH
ncbi:hypothetical protein PIB30_005707 [Stylosanthes scabra]|uniref:Bowman-Birk serine protease inhibitors family domain-containing protein n=1 Tax=Stylosanthes scabra TaxID=79078 RepID=A0ABU6V644_9FABA|nr:hypothetical protein [Stylosanthes scabra]